MKIRRLLTLTTLTLALLASCTPEDSDLGVNLTDNNTRYRGITDTLYTTCAYSLHDDSIVSSGSNYNIVGWYEDAIYGKVSASIYTQIALPSDANSVDLSNATIDSVDLCLVKDALFPDSAGSYLWHFEVMPLAEAVESDTTYYGNSILPVREGVKYFDDTVRIAVTDTVVTFRLGGSIGDLLKQNASRTDFIANTKGLRIRIIEGDSMGIVAFNFAATKTRLTAYYHVNGDTNTLQYNFVVGSGAKRFMHFDHDYSTSSFGVADSIGGTNRLYLEPFGGYNVHINFDSAVRAFHAAHPTAVIHYAELLLPLADEAPTVHPDSLLAFSIGADGSTTLTSDLRYRMGGDGSYLRDRNCYRLRVSLLLQELLRNDADHGIKLMLYYSRRHPAARTVITGTGTANPPRIAFTYTE